MTGITFDPHAFVKKLTAAGMPETQAEAVSALVREAQESAAGGLATKADLELLKRDLKIWFGGALVAAVGILLAAIRYLPPHL